MAYKRVLLKLSGEALKENSDAILSAEALDNMAQMVKKIHATGVQVCIVIGAGNIWRGKIAKDAGMDQYEADFMGMIRGTATQEQKEALDESASLEAVSHMPARVKCATLGWRTMKEMVESLLQNGTVDGRVSANNSEVCGACARTDCERK